MIQRRDRARLAFKALAPLGVSRHGRWQNLDGDVTVQPPVARAVHLAHPAGAESGEDFIGAESRAGSQSHSAVNYTGVLLLGLRSAAPGFTIRTSIATWRFPCDPPWYGSRQSSARPSSCPPVFLRSR